VIVLIRHARAGDRDAWNRDDRLRPLDARGRRQAEELVQLLAPYELGRIFSSPYLRCVQTVEPLALARGLNIELRDELSEERQQVDGARFVRSQEELDAAVCCHGGLSWVVCGESQKKGAVLVFYGTEVVARLRAKGR
jgi:phosphohistidine phosphatase SixA